MKKQAIKTFLKEFGTIVNECDEDVEIMMDDHICIKLGGIEYYVPENNSFYSEFDSEIVDYLNENHHV